MLLPYIMQALAIGNYQSQTYWNVIFYIIVYIYIYTELIYKRNTIFFPHFSWAELKDLRLFLYTEKAYFSQILFTNHKSHLRAFLWHEDTDLYNDMGMT